MTIVPDDEMPETTHHARGVVRGAAEGEALVCEKAFSFLGDVDMDTAKIIAKGHEHEGQSLAGKVLVYPETKGSSGGCIVLMVLAKLGRQPAAIVLGKPPDPNIVEGAIVSGIPLLAEPEGEFLKTVRTGDRVAVDAGEGRITVARRTWRRPGSAEAGGRMEGSP